MNIKISGLRKLRERRDRGNPLSAATKRTASDYYHEQSIESSFSARYSEWDDNQALSSQEWKADPLRWVIDDGATRCDFLSEKNT